MESQQFRLGPPPGSRVLIAGGCGGIGRDLVDACLGLGLKTIVLDIQASIDSSPLQAGATYVPFDGRHGETIATAVEKVSDQIDGLESLFFLSGFPILPRRPLAEVPLEKWEELMSVNLTSAYLLVNALTPLLHRGTDPTIVTVASSLAYQVMPGMGAYAASKGGLISLTKAFAMELAPKIRVNAVAPGAVDTKFLGGGMGREDNPGRDWFDAMSEKYVATIPLQRVAQPSDVVGPMLFLAGPASSYMTAQVIHLNGGRLTP